ncbi:hypothetical protein Dsin_028800 [Dipteronia sinensis]|uniref:RNase H type-1 domain-containing protein n=1 Tax=Dipteronia sinensis TaxID=43782 RepID=A0AAD9ZRU4_9ROSI|nr:hypothetical protein Dsin_028800 [Dipteronia sinensis]
MVRLRGLGVVILDCCGRVLISSCRNIGSCYQPQIAEALAILEGLQLAISLGFLPAILESDALVGVQAICKKEAPCSEVGIVVNDILLFLSQVFISVNFVPRLANKVSHGLAKLALSYEGEFVWFEDCPLCVESLVLGDIPNSL